MKPTVRFAETGDLERILHGIRLYLAEQEQCGSPVRLTARAVDFYRNLLRAYLEGSLAGAVTVAEIPGRSLAGFAMAGEDGGQPRFDTTLGRLAFVWLVWVDPAYRKTGLGLDLLSYGRPRLVEMGFQTASMTVREENPQGRALTEAFGGVLLEREYLFELNEQPRHLREE